MENHWFLNLIITCEHAGNQIPGRYRSLFKEHEQILQSHRGWDPGALQLAQTLAVAADSPLFSHPWSRLLVEVNRSLHHPRLFSEFTKSLAAGEKREILAGYYHPHRTRIQHHIQNLISNREPVLHIGVHTFTPVLNGNTRMLDIGLLYHPKHLPEKRFCKQWKRKLLNLQPGWRVRMNQPYRGASDGLTTTFRKQFNPESYLGIELEVNQAFLQSPEQWESVCWELARSLQPVAG